MLSSQLNKENVGYNLGFGTDTEQQEDGRTGQMQDRTDAGQDRCRTRQMQDRTDAGQDRCRTGPKQNRTYVGWVDHPRAV